MKELTELVLRMKRADASEEAIRKAVADYLARNNAK